MTLSKVLPGRVGSFAWIIASVVVGCTIALGLTSVYSWLDYRETLASGEDRVQRLGYALNAYATRTLGEAESAMRSIAQLHVANERTDQAAIRQLTQIESPNFPKQMVLQVLGGPGTAANAGEARISQALIEWELSVTVNDKGMVIGRPIRVATSKPPVVPLLLRLPSPSNGKQITVLAAISSDFLVRFHTALNLGEGTLCVLVNREGIIIARAPYIDDAIGLDISKTAIFRAAPRDVRTAVAYAISPTDGVDRVIGINRDRDFPFSAVSGMRVDELLAPWRTRAWRNLFAGLILSAIVLAFGRISWVRATAEEQSQLALSESEEHHRTALGMLAEGVVTQDQSGAILTWNVAALRILGMTEDQLRGRTSLDPRWRAVREDGTDFPGAEHPSMRALATKQPSLDIPMGIESGDAQRRWLSVSAVPTKLDSKTEGVVVSFVDVTEQREAADKIRLLNEELETRVQARTEDLARANTELSELVYTIAHDMRAPLRHIDSFAGLLASDATQRLTAEDIGLLNRIRDSAAREARLIDDLLKYTSSHQRRVEIIELDMDALVDDTLREKKMINPGYARVAWSRAPLPPMKGDYAMVRDILRILLSNAIKFSSRNPHPTIHLGSCLIAGVPAVEVRDNGVGFDMQYADKLFKMFHRLNEGEGFEGAGTGLAIAKRLIERQGGAIVAESHPGQGAVFRFYVGVHVIKLNSASLQSALTADPPSSLMDPANC